MKKGNSTVIILVVITITALLFYNNCSSKISVDKKREIATENKSSANASQPIDQLTDEKVVVPYVKKYRKLPNYYITKAEARQKGWDASAGNLCDILPGRAIGGDIFTNREGSLPSKDGRKWYEADLNYKCGRRNADRLLLSSDGLIFVTHDHYKTFQQQ